MQKKGSIDNESGLVTEEFKQINAKSFVTIISITTTSIRLSLTASFYHYKRRRLKW